MSRRIAYVLVVACVILVPVVSSQAGNNVPITAADMGLSNQNKSTEQPTGTPDPCGDNGSLCLFYGGNFDMRNGLASEINTAISDARTYDDFNVPEGQICTVTAVFGEFLASALWTTALWEVRSGAGVHDGGKIVASGTDPADRVLTGRDAFGFLEWRATATVEPFDLTEGTYHLTVAPVDNGAGRAFVSTTSGMNGIGDPLANGNSLFDSTFFLFNFEDTENPGLLGPGPWDFAFGVVADCAPAD
jgi:hypothetical protein